MEWIERVPGLRVTSVESDQHLLAYEPGDGTHYEVSLSPARFAPRSARLGHWDLRYWQFSVWSDSGAGNGTMVVESTGSHGGNIEGLERIQDKLRCSEYSARVFSILIHGCLASHDLSVAQEGIARFREEGRLGFVDPDAA